MDFENLAGIRVMPSGPDTLSDVFDLVVYAIGYESRSGWLVQNLHETPPNTLGIRFGSHETLSFADNLEAARLRGDQIAEVTENVSVGPLILKMLIDSGATDVLVDISSFPRTVLADIVSSAFTFGRDSRKIRVTFAYCVAQYSSPPDEDGPVVSFGAVSPAFSGLGGLSENLAAVIGLGYEDELALSAQQLLDPTVTWLAVPQSADSRYDASVNESNAIILDVVPGRNIWRYSVDSPFSTFTELEQVVAGLRRGHDVVVVPLGPKLIALSALLVSAIHGFEVGVWRLSPGGLRVPRQQTAVGTVDALLVEFG